MTLQKLRREQGQAVVLVALMVVVLVGSLALVVDVGNMYAERRFMQNAADAGAMAGARALALQQDPLPAVARYAQTLNGAAAFETKVLTSSVVVTATKTGQSFFAGVIGAPTYTVRAVAEAGISSPSSYDGPDLVPIAVHDRDFHTCNDSETTGWTLIWDSDTDLDAPKNPDDYPLGWDRAKDYLISGPNRGWLDLDNDGKLGNDELKWWIEHGFTERPIVVGDVIQGDPGSRSSALQAVNEFRLGKTIICPLFSEVVSLGGGKAAYRISGFAAFKVKQVQWKGYFKYVVGCFQNYVAPGDYPGGQEHNTGLSVVELRR